MGNFLTAIGNELLEDEILKAPGDRCEEYITEHGHKIKKVNTQQVNATAHTYPKKDGSMGKTTITIKEVDH